MKLAVANKASGTSLDDAFTYLSKREREIRPVAMSELHIDPENGELVHGEDSFPMTAHAGHQIASRLHITPGYVLKIPDNLAAENFNRFLQGAQGHAQLCVEDNRVVGLLKEKTIPVDPSMLIERLTEELGGEVFKLGSWWMNEQGITMRMQSEALVAEPKLHDVVAAGFDIMTRENTEMTISARSLIYRLVCTNGAIAAEPPDLRRAIIKEGWRDPIARIEMTVQWAANLVPQQRAFLDNLKAMTKMELDLPEDAMDRFGFLKTGLAAIEPKGIKNKNLVDSVSEALYQEDRTMFGLYNAVTRLGRDATVSDLKSLLEGAGHNMAVNPIVVMNAFEEALALTV